MAETILSQDLTAGGWLNVRGPLAGAAKGGSDNDGSAFWALASNGASAIAATDDKRKVLRSDIGRFPFDMKVRTPAIPR